MDGILLQVGVGRRYYAVNTCCYIVIAIVAAVVIIVIIDVAVIVAVVVTSVKQMLELCNLLLLSIHPEQPLFLNRCIRR
jgi:hypothetical protein